MSVSGALGAFTAQDTAERMRWHRGVWVATASRRSAHPCLLRDNHPLTRVEGAGSLVGSCHLSSSPPPGPRRRCGWCRPPNPPIHTPRAVNVCSRFTIPPARCNAGQSGACHIGLIGVPDRSPPRMWPRHRKGSSAEAEKTTNITGDRDYRHKDKISWPLGKGERDLF